MGKMYPKQAVEIARQLIRECAEDSPSTLHGALSPKHVRAIAFLADFVDEVRQAKDVVRVIGRLFEEGTIYPAKKRRGKERKEGKK